MYALKTNLLIVVLERFGKRKKVNICLKGCLNPEFLRLLKHVFHLCISAENNSNNTNSGLYDTGALTNICLHGLNIDILIGTFYFLF